jgi:2-polyprenyl-6-methoxyphenol hydroxylase-like FAD-dependent oxidoreductase
MRVYCAELSEFRPVGNAVHRVGESGCDLEFSCFATPHAHVDLRDRAQQHQVLAKAYQGIGWEVPKLLEMMPSAPDFYFDVAAQICMARWSRGRVVLVGDAGYCASPMSGQGTSLALIGAYVLAGELAADPVLIKLHLISTKKRCVHLLRSIRHSESNLQT